MNKKKRLAGNCVPPGFLDRYRAGDGTPTVYLALAPGFLRLEYDTDVEPSLLRRVSFVADPSPNAPAVGPLLAFRLDPLGVDDGATFIEEMGVSGFQWSGGAARWGHAYEDDAPPQEGERISLGRWVDRCVGAMINPPKRTLDDMGRRFDLAGSIPALRSGDEKARDRFWKRCSPRTGEEAAVVLELLRGAVGEGDGDLLFACCDPIKRATAGRERILDEVTALLEGGAVARDYDRSELQEVLESHAEAADAAITERWVRLCERAFEDAGPEALQAINAGALFTALSAAPGAGRAARELFGRVLDAVESAEREIREDVADLGAYRAIVKTMLARDP